VILAGSILGLMVGAKTMVAQTTTWTNTGADQLWSTTANWSNGAPDFGADVTFPALIPAGGATSLLDAGGTTNAAKTLTFLNNYTLDTNPATAGTATLTLGGTSGVGGVFTSLGSLSTIVVGLVNSSTPGAAPMSLVKSGVGTLSLTNSANTYTGLTTINDGALVISNAGQLGAGTSTVTVNGISGFGLNGGTLVVNGGTNGGVNFNRDLSLSGRGSNTAGASLVSIGNNTFSGIVTGGGASETRLASTIGTATFTNTVNLGTAGNAFEMYGSGNSVIAGQVTGGVSGTVGLYKVGSGIGSTMVLTNVNNNFVGDVRLDSGTIRVSDARQLGRSTGVNSLRGSGGAYEIRTDAPAGFSDKKVSTADGTVTIFVDHAIGSSLVGQTVTFSDLAMTASRTMAFSGRNGYGASFTGAAGTVGGAGAGSETYTNSGNGLVTILAGAGIGDGTNRTITFNGNSDTALTGNIIAGTANAHDLAKSGQGIFTLGGTASTFIGGTNVTGGTLRTATIGAASGGALNGVAGGALQLNGGLYQYTGVGESTAKLLNLSGTTGNGMVFADGTGALVLSSNVAASGVGVKTLFLGGASTADNEIQGVIQSNATTNLTKVGSGTWVYGPTAGNYIASASTTTTSAASATNNNTLPLTSAAGLVIGQSVTGTGVPAGSYITGINTTTNVITINQKIGTTAVATGVTVTFGAVANFTGTVTVGGGTLKLRGTTTTADLMNNANAIVFGTDSLTQNGSAGGTLEYVNSFAGGAGAETLGALSVTAGAGTVKVTPNAVTGGTALLNFASLTAPSAGTALNFTIPSGGSVVLLTASANSFLNAHAYYNGADFAFSPAATNSAVRAPLYTGGTEGVTSTTDLTAAAHNQITGTGTVTPAAAVSINSLKLNGSPTIDTTNGLLTINSGANAAGGILQAGGTGTIAGAGGVTTAGAGDLVVRVDQAADVLNLNAAITATTTGGLTKNGAGTLVLGAANNQTGATTINRGTVQLAAGGSLSAANQALVIRQDGTLDLNAQDILTAIGSFNGAGVVTNSAASGTAALNIGGTAGTGVFSGTIQDGAAAKLALVKNGTGIISLTGTNTFSGPVTLNGGTLAVTSLANIGTASGLGKGNNSSAATNAASLIFNGGTLLYTGANNTANSSIFALTQTPSVAIDRLFTMAGNATIDSSGGYGNNAIAARAANSAALVFNNPGAVAFAGAGSRTVTLQGDSIGDNEFRPQITDNPNANESTALVKLGAGTWILSGANNLYTGTTTITAGALRAQDGSTLPASSALIFNAAAGANAVLEMSGTFSRGIGASAGQVSWGANLGGGFAASTGKLTVNLGGAGAQVAWGTGGIGNGTGNLVLNSATALAEVELVNPIDLGTVVRTIQVDDNGTTGTDLARVSGVLSGTGGGLNKTGAGLLVLGNANTYTGATTIGNGTLAVTSIGSGGASSSLGAAGGALNIGATTVAGYLLYSGGGENVSRTINLAGTTGGATIESSGAGKLVLNTVANTGAGVKTLTLRGFNTDANEVKAVLANQGANALTVSKTDGGTWLLTGANTYTGGTSINSGYIGVGGATTGTTATALSTGAITFSNGGIFALNAGGLALSNAVSIAANTAAVFTGANSITFTGAVTGVAGNPWTISNSIASPASLTFSGNFTTAETTSRALNFTGTGDTAFNGVIPNSTTASILTNVVVNTSGSLTLGGAGANTFTGGTTLTEGTVIANKAQAFGPSGALNLNTGTLKAGIPLTGASAIVNPVVLGTSFGIIAGTNSIEFTGGVTNSGGNRFLTNNLSGGATLTISGGNVSLSNDGTNRTLVLAGTGDTAISTPIVNGSTSTASALNYFSPGTLTLTNDNTFGGALSLFNGTTVLSGTLGRISGASAISINQGAVLNLDNGTTNPTTANRTGGKNVALSGGTLNFLGNSANSAETAGTLTISTGASTINSSPSGASTNSLTFTSLTATAAGATVNFTGSGLGTAANKVVFTTPPTLTPATTGILARATVNGTDFATYGANGLAAFTGYVNPADLNTLGATDTALIDANTTTTALTGSKTVNALKFDGSATIMAPLAQTLTITSGGLLAISGASQINAPRLVFGAEGVAHVASGASLQIGGAIVSNTALTKAGAGTMTISTPQYYGGQTTVNGGTLKLSGGNNTLFAGTALAVNTGATLDLNGANEYVGALSSAGAVPNGGGTITNTGATNALLLTNVGAASGFAGTITGDITFAKAGNNTYFFESPNTYTGATYLLGNTTTLRDNATLANTSAIHISYGTLALDNNAQLLLDVQNRVNDAAPINLNGGTLSFQGRANTSSSETFGALSSLQGANTINVSVGGSGSFSNADVTFGAFSRTAGSTINFTTANTLGATGSNPHVTFASGMPAGDNGPMGAWAIAQSGHFAAYNPSQGVGQMTTPGYAGYSTNFGSGLVTNVQATLAAVTGTPTFTLPAGNTTTSMLRLSGAFTNSVEFATGTDVLNLERGGLLRSNDNNAANIGTTTTRGVLTAGGTATVGTVELVAYNAQGTMTINSVIADPGTGAHVALVKSGAGTLSLTAANTYTGGTTVNQAGLSLNGAAGAVVIPAGGLTLNGGTVTTVTNNGQIAAGNAVTLNDSSTLTLVGANTLDSLTFNNIGGIGTPTVTTGGVLALSNGAAITATSANPATTGIINGTLDFGSTNKTVNVAPVQIAGRVVSNILPTLTIGAAINGTGALLKTNTGNLQLSGASTFSGGVNLNAGGIIIAVSSTPPAGATVTSGPLGTGTLTVAGGATLLVDGTSRSVANPVVFQGTPQFDATTNTAVTLALNGAPTFASLTPSFVIANPNLTVSFGRLAASGATSISKTGLGTLSVGVDGFTGAINSSGSSTLSLLADGNGFGTVETVAAGALTFDPGVVPVITIGRVGGPAPFTQAANKIISATSAPISNGLSVINNNGYGLAVLNDATLNSGATFSVNTATASNVVQGLTLSGKLSGAGLTKIGSGTLVLTNPANDFVGDVTINAGVISINGLNLGNAANKLVLAPSTGATATLRATEDINSSRVIKLANTTDTRAIEVVAGKTLTLNAPFDLTATGATGAGLVKNDDGILTLNAANPTYAGIVTVNAGAVRLTDAGALGTGTISIASVVGAALQLDNNVSVANPITLSATANLTNGGLNFGGQLQSVSGANTTTGALSLPFDAAVGANSGATLNINGGITNSGARQFWFTGDGAINIGNTTVAATFFELQKMGNGTTTLSVPVTPSITNTAGLAVNRGTFTVNGTGKLVFTGTNPTLVNNGAILNVDDSGTATASRLGGKSITMAGGTFNYTVNSTAASTENLAGAAAIFNPGQNTINVNNPGNQASTLTIGSAAPTLNAGGAVNFTGALGTSNNKMLFGAAPTLSPATTGIMPRGTVNGTEFATYNATNGVTAFAGYSAQTDISSAVATDVFKATAATSNTVPTSQSITALTLNATPTGGFTVDAVSGLVPTTLTISSGAILANGGGIANLDVPLVALGAEGQMHVAASTTLNVNGAFSGTAGLSKNLTGALNFNSPQFYTGTTWVNNGMLKLAAGGTNTIFFNNGLQVNNGGTLDLNGGVQFAGSLNSQGAAVSTDIGGGTIANSGANRATLLTNLSAAANFGGQITGNIAYVKTGAFAETLTGANSYTGPTIVQQNTLSLADRGTLANTSAIELNYGSLTLDNTRLYDNANRINDAAPITLRGGTIALSGRSQTASSETLGALSLAQGSSNLTATAGGTGVNSTDLTFASVAQSSNATVNINTANGQLGSAGRILFTAAPTLTNNIVGPWIVSGGNDFVTYVPGLGLAALGANGAPGYDGTALPATSNATGNYKLSAASFVVPDVNVGAAGTYTINALSFAATVANQSITFADNADTLNLASGGFAKNGNFAGTVGTAVNNGILTAGGSTATGSGVAPLYIQQNSSTTFNVNSVIADNAATGDKVRLVYTAYNAANLVLAGTNTYSGGTVVNGGAAFTGTLSIAATGTLPAGGLTINSATVSQTAAGTIAPQDVTLNGAGALTLANQANTLSNLIFNANGSTAPTVTPTGTLTVTGGITSHPSNVNGVATIGTGTLDLNGNNSFSVTVDPTQVNNGAATVNLAPLTSGLIISSVVQNGGIAKNGAGNLQLSGQSTFSGGVRVNSGALILAASSTPSNVGGTLVTGPLGTGTLTMANGTTLIASAASTLLNDVVFEGAGPVGAKTGSTFFAGTNSVTFNGNSTLPNTWNADIAAPSMTVTLANAINSVGSDVINKSGLGTLTVGNFNGIIQAAGGLLFIEDGNGLGTPESISLGGGLVITGNTSITVNRTAAAPTALNKTLQKTTLELGANTVTDTNSNGYGLEFTGTTTLDGVATLSVANATNSNVVQGLTLSGKVTGPYGFVKSGLGTLALTNSGNDFGGAGQFIDLRRGVLSVQSDGALGDPANQILMNVNAATAAGFRSTGTFSTGRTFILNQATNAFEVTQGNVLTLNTPFSLTAAGNALAKNDNGVLAINAANPTWTGPITINAGAVRALNDTALGSGAVTIAAATGAGLQLAGAVNVSNPLAITTSANGINSAGVIQSVAGVNTYSGAYSQPSGSAGVFGADAGSTLNLTGSITSNGNSVSFTGGGIINLSLPAGFVGGGSTFNKLGSGTLNVLTANPGTNAPSINVTGGTIRLANTGSFASLTTGTNPTLLVDAGATLTLDNSTANGSTAMNNRLSAVPTTGGTPLARPMQFRGATLNVIGHETTTVTEAMGTPTLSRGFTTINLEAKPGAQLNVSFSGSATVPANAQNSGTAPSGVSLYIRGTGLGSAAANGVATIKDLGATNGFAFNGQNGATGATSKGIAPYMLVENTTTGVISFGTGDSGGTTNAGTIALLRPLNTGTEMVTNTLSANTNARFTQAMSAAAAVTPNSLTFEPGSGSLTISPLIPFNLSSGGVLVKTPATISGGVVNQTAGFSPLNLWTLSDLEISSQMNGGNGISNGNIGVVKAGAGTLTISSPVAPIPGISTGGNTYSGQLVINQGTVKLNGGTNTIQANNFVSLDGGTLDLNGNAQTVLGLFTDGAVAGAGGTVSNSAAAQATLVNNADNTARNFAGAITGSVFYNRAGQSTLTFFSPQTYTGNTLINGGTTVLRDEAALLNTPAIDLNFATLTLDNATSIKDVSNRINDAAPIALRSGSLVFNGRAQMASSETVGAVTLAAGNSFINSVVGGTGINSSDLTLTSLTRAVGGGTVNFTAATGGQIGNASRILIPTINGVSTATAGAALTNGIIGGWATIATSDFATYVPGLGIAAMGSVGAPAYATATTLSAATLPTDNVKLNTGVSTLTQDLTVNAIATSNIAVGAINLAAGKTLTIGTGGLLSFTNTSWNVGTVIGQGSVTSGGPEMFIYAQGSGIPTFNSVLTGAMSVHKTGANTVNLVANNNYTGGTFVDQGTLTLNGAAGVVTIPAAADPTKGLVITSGTVTMNNIGGQIAPANVVTLNGSGTLNLGGNNTFAGLVFNNTGGNAPTLNGTGVFTPGAGGIVASSSNVTNTSILSGRTDFGATAGTVTVNPVIVNGLEVAPFAPALEMRGIVGSTAGFIKEGTGALAFGAAEVFTGPVQVNSGTIMFTATGAGSRFANYVLNGPLAKLNVAANAPVIGQLSGNGTVFNSSAATGTLAFGYNNQDSTFTGQFMRLNDGAIGALALNKIGTGTFNLTTAQGVNGSAGNFAVSGGSVVYKDAGAAFAGSASLNGSFTVNTGGTLRLDNSGMNVDSRLGLGVGGSLILQGGEFIAGGNATSDTTENLATLSQTNGGGGVVTLNANAAAKLRLNLATLTAPNATGTLLIRGLATTAAPGVATFGVTTFNTQAGQGTTGNGTFTMPVRADIIGDVSPTGLGTGFVVKDSVSGVLRPLDATEVQANAAQWGATINAALNGAVTVNANGSVNSFTTSGSATLGSGLGFAFGAYNATGGVLTQTVANTGAVLVASGTTNFNTALTSGGAPTLNLHVLAGATLNVNGNLGLGSTNGLIKSDGGVLNLNQPALFTAASGGVIVNGGTLNLNSGAENTVLVNPTATVPTTIPLAVNSAAATLDLKGNAQAFAAISSVNPLPGQGGTITNSGAAGAMLTSTGGGTFAGQMTGALAFTRSGNNTTTLTSASGYTGDTTVRGGILQLRDGGSILNTSSIDVEFGTLNVDQSGLSALADLNPTRISASTPITLRGGALTLTGGGSIDATLNTGTVTAAGGSNSVIITANTSGASHVVTIGNLVRAAGSGTVVNFTSSSGIGGQGAGGSGDVILSQLNGSNFTAANLSNNLIGGWAVVNGDTFATYVNGFGVGVMGSTVNGVAFPAFTGTDITSTTATGNYNDAGTGTTALVRTFTTGAKSSNSWRFAQTGAALTVTPVAGTTFSFGTGIITNSSQAVTIGAVDATNTITGPANGELYVSTNGTGVVSVAPLLIGTSKLIKGGAGTLTLNSIASNTYSGGTFVQQGLLNLSAAAGVTVIPGDLTINNATVTMNTNPQQIAAASNVAVNGGGVLNLVGTNTLGSLSFNNSGGTATPTVATATLLNLSAANALTVVNDSLSTTPTISGTALAFTSAAPVMSVSGLSRDNLIISAPITSSAGAITKTASGAVVLSGASTFNNGFNLNGGSFILGASSTPTTGTVTSGPLGTGTLTVNGGTLLSDGTARTVANSVTLAGDLTFGGVLGGANVTLTGAVDFGNANRTINVSSPAVMATLTGAIGGTSTGTGLTKAGPGVLVLAGANSFTGSLAIAGGVLKNGAATAIPAGAAMNVSTGAGFDLNGFNSAIGSLSGSGFVTNSGATPQSLVVGGTGAADTVSSIDSTFSGVLTNGTSALSLIKAGAGTLTLSGVNSYTGTTTVNAGALQVAADNNLGATTAPIVLNAGKLQFTGTTASDRQITLADVASTIVVDAGKTFSANGVTTGAGNLVKSGAGTLVLVNQVSNYSGATILNQGILTTDSVGMEGIFGPLGSADVSDPAKLVLNAGGTFQYTGIEAQTNRLFTVGAGAGIANLDASGTGKLEYINPGPIALGGLATDTHTLRLTGSSNPTVDNTFAPKLTGKLSLIKSGTNTWVLQANNDFTDGTVVESGTLQLGNGGATGNVDGGMVTVLSGATLAFNHSDPVNFSHDITGAGSVVNRGAGALTLSGTNTFQGETRIGAGTQLTVAMDGALGFGGAGTVVETGGTLRVAVNYTLDEPLTLNGSGLNNAGALALGTGVTAASFKGPITIATNSTISPTTDVTGQSGTLTLTGGITKDHTTLTFQGPGTVIVNGVISGGDRLADAVPNSDLVVDASKVVLNSLNTYYGPTSVINNGTLVAGSSSALPADTILTLGEGGGTFDLNGNGQSVRGLADTGTGAHIVTSNGAANSTGTLTVTGTSTFGGTIQNGSGATALTVSGAGTQLTLTGANTYTGGTTIAAGTTLSFGNGGATGSLAGNITNDGTLKFNRTGTVTIGSDISGAGTLVQAGSGRTILTGTETFTGDTNVQAGTLEVRASLTGSVNVSTGATFDVSHLTAATYNVAASRTLAANGTVEGALDVSGTVSGNGTVTGAVNVLSGGELNAGGIGTIGTLTSATSLSFASGSKLTADLAGPSPLNLSDLAITPSVTLGSNVSLNLQLLSGYSGSPNGDVFFLVNNTGAGSVTGSFANATTPTSFGELFGGQTYDVLNQPVGADNTQFAITYSANFATGSFTGGNDIALMAVPEPSTATALLTGLAALGGLRRFRRRKV
jgi:autotransporter-associated beta strand protein